MTQNISRTLFVRCSMEHAFHTFTECLDLWWPPGHRRNRRGQSKLAIEGRVGGRFFEQSEDGSEFEFGKVLQWDPPKGLRYAWYMGSSRELPTEVHIRFSMEGEGTKVEVLHEPARGVDAWPKAIKIFRASWTTVLDAYQAHIDAEKHGS